MWTVKNGVYQEWVKGREIPVARVDRELKEAPAIEVLKMGFKATSRSDPRLEVFGGYREAIGSGEQVTGIRNGVLGVMTVALFEGVYYYSWEEV